MLGWLLGFLWLAVLKAWLGSHLALDADALGVGDLWNSLHAAGHLGDWVMGPHPYVFPDLPIYGIAAQFAPDPLGRQLCYGLIQGFLLWWFLARLMKRLWGLEGSSARAYSAAGLLLLLPCFSPANGLGQALAPGYHGGALLCGLAFLSWVLKQDRRLSSWPAVLWASLLVGLVWASDQIVPVWALLPGLVLSVGLGGRARRRIWGAAALSWAFRDLVLAVWERRGMQVAHFQWPYFWTHSGALVASLGSQLAPALAAAAAPVLLGLLALGLMSGRPRVRPLSAWLALALLLTVLGGLALAGFEGSLEGRYFIGFVWLSAPLVPLLFSLRLEGSPLPLVAAALLGLLCLGRAQPSPAEPMGVAQAQWLDSRLGPLGLRQGLADYDHARPLSLLSRQGLVLAQVTTQGRTLRPYLWIVDRRIFSSGSKAQFVVLNGLDAETVRAALGKPVTELDGAGLAVWIYARPRPGTGI